MHYRNRHAEAKLRRLAEHFKVVLVTGARQVGKSTLLQHVFPNVKAVVFDPVQDSYGARRDPDLFLQNFPSPLILDEIQFAPELLPALKRKVDQVERPGQYLLSGSQNLSVLRSVAETMTGRVVILQLEGMSLAEMAGRGEAPGWLGFYLDAPGSLPERFAGTIEEGGPLSRHLWRGSMPGMLDTPDDLLRDAFRSYVQTYVERDLRLLEDIRELSSFGRFLGLTAALTGQEINASQFGREAGVTPATARKWLALLAHTFQWRELPPYHGSTVKRLTGKSKGYLRDTGLACSLQLLSSPDALAVSPLLGAMFETWAVNEVHRQFTPLSVPPQAYHWRTAGGAEVDLVLERDGKLYPIEVKCKSHVTREDARSLRAFAETYPSPSVMPGLIIYAGRDCLRVDERTTAVPWNAFFL